MILRSIYCLLLGTRPKTLIATFIPIIMVSSVIVKFQSFSTTTLILILSSALLIQIGTNYANDYYDAIRGGDTSKRLGPKRFTQSGDIPKNLMKWASFFCFGISFIIGLYLVWLGGLWILFIGLASIFFGYAYTGGPYPLAYNGLGDVFVLIFFGPVSFGGTHLLLTGYAPFSIWMLGLIPGFLAVGLLVINNLRDQIEDRSTNKRTLVVIFGRLFGLIEYASCTLAVGIWIILLGLDHSWPSIIFTLPFFIGLLLLYSLISKPPHVYNKILAAHALYSVIVTFLFCCIYLI